LSELNQGRACPFFGQIHIVIIIIIIAVIIIIIIIVITTIPCCRQVSELTRNSGERSFVLVLAAFSRRYF